MKKRSTKTLLEKSHFDIGNTTLSDLSTHKIIDCIKGRANLKYLKKREPSQQKGNIIFVPSLGMITD